MKLLILLTVAACFQASARGYGQVISVSFQQTPLEKVFREIEKKTGYSFIYTRSQAKLAQPVNCQFENVDVKEVLNCCFRDQALSFIIEDKYIIVQSRLIEPPTPLPLKALLEIHGRVTNENGDALAGVTVMAKNSKQATASDEKGEFLLRNVPEDDWLILTSVGFEKQEIHVNSQTQFQVRLKLVVGSLDETIIIAYGKTTKRLSTSNVGHVSAKTIEQQPVSNPLAALSGRVAGLVITQNSGIPGSGYTVQIRGRNSIKSGTAPLFIIDGVPAAANNDGISVAASSLNPFGGLSPFSSINPQDIESIEVLKDADATAIYGSRGANGVILITTKKGKPGKVKTELSIVYGASKVGRTIDMMKTPDYLMMRREAFANDNKLMTASNAKDLLIWDTTRCTDFKKLLIGNTADNYEVNASVSGGSDQTQFLIGAGYHYETTVFPGDQSDKKGSFHFNLNHSDVKKKFTINLSGSYYSERNQIPISDLTGFLTLPPNTPDFFKEDGTLNWNKDGFNFPNPFGFLNRQYSGETNNLLGNLKLSYQILPRIAARLNLGYNNISVNDYNATPISSQNPAFSPVGFNSFGSNLLISKIAEPQIEYIRKGNRSSINLLIGCSWQQNDRKSAGISGYGYENDDLIGSIAAAPEIQDRSNSIIQYKYAAIFSRFTYNILDKYIFNLGARRDGSSRFGPNNRYANFGSGSVAWIFSKEKFIQRFLPFISFGKLRFSYGSTGNDRINDYRYLDSWSVINQGYAGLVPTSLFNPNYQWEKNKKLEGGIELGFLNDGLQFSVSYYQNRSSNQLVEYTLPSQAGFELVTRNFPAKVQNAGIEIESFAQIITNKNINWNLSLNVSFPRNKLLYFPDLANSSYSNLVIGEPLDLIRGLLVKEVDPQSGLYVFQNQKGETIPAPDERDRINNLGTTNPKYIGGIGNTLSIQGFEIFLFAEFRKQIGKNYLYDLSAAIPGSMNNQPVAILDRWTKPGDIASIQKYTTGAGSAAFLAYLPIRVNNSQTQYSDASFLRLRTISLAYFLPGRKLFRRDDFKLTVFLRGQNLLTITNFNGGDPETQSLYNLPPLKTLVFGIKLIAL